MARQMGASLTEKGNIKVNDKMESSIPGLFAAGDCTGGLLQVAKAVYDGADAADALAIAIGTSHGAYKFKGDPSLDFARLEKISALLPNFPLVLHGASTVLPEFVAKCNQFGGKIDGAQGVPEDMLLRAGKLGVCKINIDTDLRLALTAAIREHMALHPADFDPRQYLKPARDAIKGMVQHKIKNVLNCSGKA